MTELEARIALLQQQMDATRPWVKGGESLAPRCWGVKLEDGTGITVGAEWFNSLTESNVVMTFPGHWTFEVRDHDGNGDEIAYWPHAHDGISEIGYTVERAMRDACSEFLCYCRDQLRKYEAGLAAQADALGFDRAAFEAELKA